MTKEDLESIKFDLNKPSLTSLASDPKWKQAFNEYNENNTVKLNMQCRPCYSAVYYWHLKQTNL